MQTRMVGLLGALVFGAFAACDDSYVIRGGKTDGQGGSEPNSNVAPTETGESGAGDPGGGGGGDAGAPSCVANEFCHESSGGNCSCSGTCNGQSVKIGCGWATGEPRCTCYVGGVEVGTCTHPNGGYLCGLDTTCCNQFFF